MKSAIKFLPRASLVLAGLFLLQSCGGGDGDVEPLEIVVARDTDAGAAQRPQVTFTISNGAGVNGSMVITLVPEYAPVTVANFLNYVNSGFYVGTIIHRHDAGFVLQGGGYVAPVSATDSPNPKLPNAPIALEVKVSNVLGTIAMARTNVLNSATSQFFINLANNSALDLSGGGYAAFGYITDLTLVTAMTTPATAPCVSATITGGTALGCLPVPNLVITAAAKTR
jgi:cyclophilin family peptidyl-prolyl cis-trans isomerase